MQGLWGTVTSILSVLGNIASIVSCGIAAIGLFQLWPAILEWRLKRQAWKLYLSCRIQAGEDIYGKVWTWPPGSREFELAENLVERGLMFHRELGSYGLWHEGL